MRYLTAILVGTIATAALVARSQEAPRSAADGLQVSDWSEEVSGLQVRATLLKQIEEGMPLVVLVEFRVAPQKLSPGIKVIALYGRFTVRLEGTEAPNRFDFDEWYPTRESLERHDGGTWLAPIGEQISPYEIQFPVLRAHGPPPPGTYRCTVVYTRPGKPNDERHGPLDDGRAATAWTGMVESAPVLLRVVPETPKSQTFLLPKRLRAIRKEFFAKSAGRPSGNAGLAVAYFNEDTERVTVPVRNGYELFYRVFVDGEIKTISGGPPKPEPERDLDRWFRYERGDRAVTYKIALLETCNRLADDGDDCGWRLLWERTFELNLSEPQIMAVLNGEQPYALSGEGYQAIGPPG